MSPRVREILDYLKTHPDLSPFSAFGPPRRDSVRPFVGGGAATLEEYRAVMAAIYPPQPITVDGRNRVMAAHDSAVNRHL
jgi:hypothetical protein